MGAGGAATGRMQGADPEQLDELAHDVSAVADRLSGPSTYWIDAAGQVRPSVMQSLRATAGLTDTAVPDLPAAVRAAVPDGPWQAADELAATSFASPGFGTHCTWALTTCCGHRGLRRMTTIPMRRPSRSRTGRRWVAAGAD